jgi:hypothetical protein
VALPTPLSRAASASGWSPASGARARGHAGRAAGSACSPRTLHVDAALAPARRRQEESGRGFTSLHTPGCVKANSAGAWMMQSMYLDSIASGSCTHAGLCAFSGRNDRCLIQSIWKLNPKTRSKHGVAPPAPGRRRLGQRAPGSRRFLFIWCHRGITSAGGR